MIRILCLNKPRLLPVNKMVSVTNQLNTSVLNNLFGGKKKKATPTILAAAAPAASPPPPPPSSSAPAVTPPKPPDSSSNRIQRMEPGKVIFGFIPQEWADFFYEKTGVTGFYTFIITFSCYLASKEKFVMEHDYYGGLGMLLLWILMVKYGGPSTAKYLDKEVDQYENEWNIGRENHKQSLNDSMKEEEVNQKNIENNLLIVAAQREAIHTQQETEYRQRLMTVYQEVLKRLNYQLRMDLIKRRYTQKNMLDWIKKEVLKQLTPEWNNKYVDDCINILEKIPRSKVN